MKSKLGVFFAWFFAVFCLSSMFIYGITLGAIIFFMLGVVALPIKPIQDIWAKAVKDKKWIKPTMIGILFVVGMMLLPQNVVESKNDETTTNVSEEFTTSSVDKDNEATDLEELTTVEKQPSAEETTIKEEQTTKKEEQTTKQQISVNSIPAYSGKPYVAINSNEPYFTSAELTTKSYEVYSDLDGLGRCGVTMACVGKDIMPTEERGSIGQVKPTGWHTIKYDCVDGKYLYNRCHLIGFQLTGENANTKNLITGTRSMNVDGMLPFENMVADYVEETGNHVMYRVTPMFEGDNLLANGVLMEAKSVEDNGDGILFCVFVYNVQDGVVIDYKTGDSHLKEEPTTQATPTTTKEQITTQQTTTANNSGGNNLVWISETGSKYHSVNNCGRMNPANAYQMTKGDAENKGYGPCSRCH